MYIEEDDNYVYSTDDENLEKMEESEEFDDSYFYQEFGVPDDDFEWLYYEEPVRKKIPHLPKLYVEKPVIEISITPEFSPPLPEPVIEINNRKELIEQSKKHKIAYEKTQPNPNNYVMKPNAIRNRETKKVTKENTIEDYEKLKETTRKLIKEKVFEKRDILKKMGILSKQFNNPSPYHNYGGSYELSDHEKYYALQKNIRELDTEIEELQKMILSYDKKIETLKEKL